LLKTRQQLQVATSNLVATPVACGWFRPVIILPSSSASRVSGDELHDVLVHEAAHILRRDHLVLPLQLVAGALFWPIWTVHLLNRRLDCAREEVCDNYVLALRDGILYGETLLHLAELAGRARLQFASVGILHWKGQLEARIEGLISEQRNTSTIANRWTAIAVLCLCLLTSLPICGTKLVAMQNQPLDSSDTSNTSASQDVSSGSSGPKSSGKVSESTSQPASGRKDESKPDKSSSTHLQSSHSQPNAPTFKPVFIIAKHQIIYAGRAVTWDQVRTTLKALASATNGSIHPSFQFTNGVIDQWNFRQKQIAELRQEVGFRGHSVGSLWPRAGARYDAIKTPEDLKPDESKRRRGRVLGPDGSAVEGAEVILLPNDAVEVTGGFTIVLQEGRLREPYAEIITTTDADGNFDVYPGNRYQIVVLHKAGFGRATSEQFDARPTITLERLVRVAGSIDRSGTPDQSVYVQASPKSSSGYPPVTLMEFNIPISEKGSFDYPTLPPGDLVVMRGISEAQGVGYNVTAAQIPNARPGSEHKVTIGRWTEKEQQQIDSIKKQLDESRRKQK